MKYIKLTIISIAISISGFLPTQASIQPPHGSLELEPVQMLAEAETLPEAAYEALERIPISPEDYVRNEARNVSTATGGDCAAEIAKYNWNVNVALAVSRAESGLNPAARGDTGLTYFQNGTRYGDSWGCFQIRYLHGRPTPTQLVNAEFNVRYAHGLWKSQGWSPWSVCKTKVSCY